MSRKRKFVSIFLDAKSILVLTHNSFAVTFKAWGVVFNAAHHYTPVAVNGNPLVDFWFTALGLLITGNDSQNYHIFLLNLVLSGAPV